MSDGTKAEVIEVNGRKSWLIDGRVLPYIAGGSPGGDPPKDPPSDPPADPPAKVEFTPEQQAHVDSIINKKFADVHTKAEAKAQGAIDELKAEIETLKVSKEPGKKENKGNEDLTALTEKIAVLEADKIKGFQVSSESNIIAAASDLKAVDARQVYELVRSSILIADDGTRTVVNSEKKPRITEGGQPMTEKELVAEFLTNNQHHVQASGKVGSGSQAPGFGEDNNEDLSKLSLEDQLTAVRAANKNK